MRGRATWAWQARAACIGSVHVSSFGGGLSGVTLRSGRTSLNCQVHSQGFRLADRGVVDMLDPTLHSPGRRTGNPAPKPTRVLAVDIDVDTVRSLLPPLRSTSTVEVETARDFLHAVERLLSQEWDVVVATVGDDGGSELQPWLEALGEARGHPRFIAMVKRRSTRKTPDGGSTLAQVEMWHVARVVERTGGRIETAARILGVHRNTLARKLKAMGDRAGEGGGQRQVG